MSTTGGPLSEQYPNNISFTWNTDGIPVFKSSKFSLWPFYLVINELPYKQRMMKENMILCGLWFGETKPFISLFTKPLMKSLKNLESKGIEYEIGGCKVVTQAYLICGTADLPAKSLVLNCNQFNGQYSCMRCVHPGETYKTAAGGSVHVFPYDASKSMYEERTSSNCLEDAAIATESRKTFKGIKGPSFLMTLKSYDYVKSSSIDYMHGVLLGIGKLLIKLWIGSSHSKEKFSISSYVDIIDERLLKIKPPSVITRVPRSLSEHFKYWKASEIRSWLQFYSLPVLCDILPEEYFMHFACYVQGIYLLSSDSISPVDLQKSQSLLSYFVHMFPSLYGERYVTLNMHSLLHLTQCVKDLGPLWVYSCFPFENINGVLMELFHGTQNIELQIMYSINVVQSMSLMVKGINDQNLIHFADKMNHKNNSAKAIIGTSAASFPIGASSNITLSDTLFGKLVNEVKFVPLKILSYKRISLRGNTLHSTAYTRVQVRNTYTIKYYDSAEKQFKYGCIAYYILAKKCECVKEICMCNSTLIAVIGELECTGLSIINPNFLSVDVPHINIVQKTNNVHLVDVTKILNVVVFIDIFGDDGKKFVCDFPNVKESD
ncbi:uncharacterized protein LOC134708578 [Mytilus trossulus]|uniref:uncharacterized protein LOC134708578 n=1 Tax=Mytilus trossulus TaxID=6551 RepID=UPI003004BBE7